MSEKIVQLNEEVIKGQIKKLVRGSVEEALIEMYLAGISVRRVVEITKTLWGAKISPLPSRWYPICDGIGAENTKT